MPALQIALTLASTVDFAAYDLSPIGVARAGARILKVMTAALTRFSPFKDTIADTLAAVWSPDSAALLNAALVLCADHELNASSFTARVTASAEANPYAVVQAGLATLQGFKHGGHTARVSAFMREVGSVERVQQAIGERLRRGDNLFGFGHLLYPEGDPRAKMLLNLLTETHANSPDLILSQTVIEAVHNVNRRLAHYRLCTGSPRTHPTLTRWRRTIAVCAGSHHRLDGSRHRAVSVLTYHSSPRPLHRRPPVT